MAFRNSLLLIAFFLVATTSVANCQLPSIPSIPGIPGVPGVSNLVQAVIVVPPAIFTNVTAGVGVRILLPVVNVTLNCSGVLIGLPTVVSSNGALVLTVRIPNTLPIPSCNLSANVSIGGVTNTVTSTLLSLPGLISSVTSNFNNIFLALLSALLVNGTSIAVRA